MSECKRILNKEVAGEGLWQTDLAKCQGEQEGEVVEIQPAEHKDDSVDENDDDDEDRDINREKHSGAAEHAQGEREGKVVEIQPAEDKDDSVDENDDDDEDINWEKHSGAAEHAEAEREAAAAEMPDDQCDKAHEHREAAPHPEAEEEVDTIHLPLMAETTEQNKNDDGAVEPEKAPAQIFQLTISLRDDWLHRGEALLDMDLQTYAEVIERRPKPIRGADTKKILAQPTFAFDAHYKLAPGFMQVCRQSHTRALARFNLPNCLRENVNGGEENAQFKAFHCSLIRCSGAGMCADPLMCAPTMFPDSKGP